MFVIFGAFFEMIFSASLPFGLRQIVFPIALILLGVYLVLVRSGLLSGSRTTNAPPMESSEPSVAKTKEEK